MAPPRPRAGNSVATSRSAAATASWIFRGDEPRPRGVDIPRRGEVATLPRIRRFGSRACDDSFLVAIGGVDQPPGEFLGLYGEEPQVSAQLGVVCESRENSRRITVSALLADLLPQPAPPRKRAVDRRGVASDRFHQIRIGRVDQRRRARLGARARGAADSVQMRDDVRREVVLHDVVDARQVQAARREVRADEDLSQPPVGTRRSRGVAAIHQRTIHVAAAASPRFIKGLSASHPRRRRDSSEKYPRRLDSRSAAARHGKSPPLPTPRPRPRSSPARRCASGRRGLLARSPWPS